MSYWTPRADAPMAYCDGGGCHKRTDCRRWLERGDLNARGATALPMKDQWRPAKLPMQKVQQVCDQFLPRESE